MTTDPLTAAELIAVAAVDLDRLNDLSMAAARGDDPADLTADEAVVFGAMRRHVEQHPGVAWSPAWDG